VPKRDLVAAVLVAMQKRQLQIAASLPDAEVLIWELENFRVTTIRRPPTIHTVRGAKASMMIWSLPLHWLCGRQPSLDEANLFQLNMQGVEETTSPLWVKCPHWMRF